MEQTVYIDLYFLINFSMDFLGLFLAAKLLSYRVPPIRCILSALFGAGYACVALLYLPSDFVGLVIDIVGCVIMATIALKRKGNLRQVGGYAIVYTAVSILLGGFMTAMFSLFNKIGFDKLWGTEQVSDGISVWLFALFAAISGIVSLFGGKFFRTKSARQYGRVRVVYNERNVVLNALCDSGNLLREPISSKLCIVTDLAAAYGLFSKAEAALIRRGEISELDVSIAQRIRIVPIGTVKGNGLLYAFRADKVSIDMGKGWCDVDAYIAFSELGGDNGEVRALIPSELVFGAP